MKTLTTITYRKGKHVKTITLENPLVSAICTGIDIPVNGRLDAVAWCDVLSIVITTTS